MAMITTNYSMKKIPLIIACVIPSLVFSQASLDITPKVKSVTLYQYGALVTHEGETSIGPGKTTVVFHGLPSSIDKQSIQLSSNSDIVILSVTSHDDYLSINRNNTKVKRWQDSLEDLNEEIQTVNNRISILQDGKKLLDDNLKVGGTSTGTTVTSVKSMYDYYVKQVHIIDDSLMFLRKRLSKYQNRMQKIANEVDEWKAKTDTVASDVEASISSEKRQTVSFRISYLTYDASWAAVYDLRAQDTKHPCQFSYKANISQHTGQDWNNVDLTLSSSNPVVNQTAPVISPWYLTFMDVNRTINEISTVSGRTPAKYGDIAGGVVQFSSDRDAEESEKTDIYTTRQIENSTRANQLSVEFHIDVPYSLPSDDKPHTVEIKKYDLNAFYHYQTIPKLQRDVFLLAGITNWEELNILQGEVNIYYAGAYVGKSFINPENTADTLNFSLGMDKKIVVKRTRTKDFSSTQWIGSNKTQTFGWVITLHNSQSDSLSLDVFDQIPVSTDKDMIVTALDLGGAKENSSGKLTWHISLAAGETKKLTFAYSVKYPKDKTIPNLWQ